MITNEMIKRLATLANGGSFANLSAEAYAVDKVVKVLFNLTTDDVKNICEELKITLD